MKAYLLIGLCCVWSAGVLWAEPMHDHIKIAQDNADAIVAINVLKKDGSTFTGTGFVLSPDGLIATNKHVMNQALYANITFNSGIVSAEAREVAKADKVDLSVLQINAQHLPYVTLGDSDTVLPGQTITVIGNPRRLQNTVSSGLISQVRQKSDGTLWHQISAPISHSSSGSPVFNANGEVISIAFGSYAGEGDQNLNFAVPVNYLKTLLAQNGYILPEKETKENASSSTNRFWAHLQKSWEIAKRIFSAEQK